MANPVAVEAAPTQTTFHLSAARFAGLLFLLMLVSFPDILLFGNSFVLRDFSAFGYPLAYYHRESFWQGEMPLWNPLSNGGLPFLAQWNTLTLYPLSLLYLLLPMPWSLSFFCLAHLFLAGMGMFFLVRKWTGHCWAAGFSGLTFAFSGLLLNSLIWPNNMAAFGWMPWVLLTVETACAQGGKRLLPAILVSALQMLSGAPEVIMLTWGLTAALWLLALVQQKESQGRSLRRLVVIVLGVSGLAAAQLLPFLDLMNHGERDYEILHRGIPDWGVFNYFVPLLRMMETPQGFFVQPKQIWTTSYYVSLIALALAVLALALRPRCRRVWLLAGLVVFSLLMATGGNGPFYFWMCRLVPGLDHVHFPVKFVIVPTLVLPLLAGIAFAEWQNATADKAKRALYFSLVISFGFLLVMGGVLWWARSHPLPGEKWVATWQNGLSRAALFAGILTLAAVLPKLTRDRARWIAAFALLLLVWLDSFIALPKLAQSVNSSVFAPNLSDGQFQTKPQHGVSRIAMSRTAGEAFYGNLLSDPAKDLLAKRLVLFANCNLQDGVPKVGGFYSTYLPGQLTMIKELFFTSADHFPETLADFLSVSHINNATNPLQWDFRPTHLPMATLGPKPVFLDFTQTRMFMRRPEFDPRQIVCLPPEAQSAITVTNAALGKIIKSHFTPHRIEIEAEAGEPALLVLSHAFYHCWQATVDGQPTQIFRANRAFQALQIPAGRHQVKLVYVDQSFRWGVIISVLTLVAVVVAWLRLRRLSQNEK